MSFNNVGDVQMAQGDLAGALKSYNDSLAIRDRLAKSDPGNAGWQRDLSVSYERAGDVQVAQGDLAGALKSYNDSLAIFDRLAKSDPGNAGWQRDLAVSNEHLGDVYTLKIKSSRPSPHSKARCARAALCWLGSPTTLNPVCYPSCPYGSSESSEGKKVTAI